MLKNKVALALVTVLALVALGLTGCAGAAGAQGPAGPAGPPGTATLPADITKQISDAITKQVAIPIAATVTPNRGCPACHTGKYTLAAEATAATTALGAGNVHPTLPDTADVTTCLTCHAPGTGASAGKGVGAPISLRDIVHPVHMGSQIFKVELGGDCFSCHNVSADGTFQVLTQKVQTNAKGVPNLDQLPIPGAVDPR